MSGGQRTSRWIFGLCVGAGIGFAAALLLLGDTRRAELRRTLVGGARGLAGRLGSPGRRSERAGRDLENRLKRLRASGL